MTKEELAGILDGMEYGDRFPDEAFAILRSTDLVVVMGASDDMMDFYGAIKDEVDCYGGGIAYLDKHGFLKNECDDHECPYFMRISDKAPFVQAMWNDEGDPCWLYKTDIPHAKFKVMAGGDIYCLGIVFNMSEVRELIYERDSL